MRAVFEGALALPPHERDGFVAASCGTDLALRGEVERMLASHEGAGDFLAPRSIALDADSTAHLEGRRIGPYLLSSRIGAGGMGEVYKARDTRLDRTVAIKVLAPQIADDPQSRQRFEVEARAAAALSHPHICTLHDIGREPATASTPAIDYLVMEYLEGETLAARLAKGPLSLTEALRCATQILSALDRAHRAGIVHRDLKPGNVMLTKAGAKLLDFGLAKPSAVTSDRDAATRPRELTTPGIILGTLHYLAPEQVEGREADARTDIFAFGSLLFEMLTGRKAFEGNTQANVMAAILEHPHTPVSTLVAQAPPLLEETLKRCLMKDPDDRWQSARDVMFALETIGTVASATDASAALPRRRRTEWAGYAVAGLLAAALGATLLWRSPAPATPLSRLSISPPEQTTFMGGYAAPHLALSPDGRRLAFVPTPIGGRTLLWIRDLDSLTARALPATDGATYPFWSPDGHSIGFFADGKLKTMDVTAGVPQAVADAPDSRGGAWGDGVIVFAPQLDGPLFRVAATGGGATAITTLDASRQETSHRLPSFLPDGHKFLFLVQSGKPENSVVAAASVDSPDVQRLNIRGSKAAYAAGSLVFAREQLLVAQPFDLRTLQLSGEPTALGDQVAFRSAVYGDALFAVGSGGTLAYWNGAPSVSRLMWFDRKGETVGTVGKPGEFLSVALSPDEKKIAVELVDPAARVGDIWSVETDTGISSRVTIDPGWDFGPVWSPDGREIVFGSIRAGRQSLYRATASGTADEKLLLSSSDALGPSDWSLRAGLVFQNMSRFKVGVLAPSSGTASSSDGLPSSFAEADGHLSPDGRWLVYTSNESGTWDVYVRSFPALDQKRRISPDGGSRPMWRRDGKELFYMAPDQTLMTAAVKADEQFATDVPTPLFQARTIPVPATQPRRQFAASARGDRFLVNTVVEPAVPTPVTVVLNWARALAK